MLYIFDGFKINSGFCNFAFVIAGVFYQFPEEVNSLHALSTHSAPLMRALFKNLIPHTNFTLSTNVRI